VLTHENTGMGNESANEHLHTFAITSELNADPRVVWEHMTSMSGVNSELAPWLHMTYPKHAARIERENATSGQPLFTSTLLFLGMLPVDRHRLRILAVNDGLGFHEDSTSLMQARWIHIRAIERYNDDRCLLRDEISFRPRIRILGPALRPIVRAIFRWRHRQLRKRFGTRPHEKN
jgi:ligand-binding SRPBCC domain-containing protein